jgi:hypothetical protein
MVELKVSGRKLDGDFRCKLEQGIATALKDTISAGFTVGLGYW